MSTRKTLRDLAEARRGVLVPGAFNALSARVIEDLGFEAIYITGAGVTNMWFGLPDQGFMGDKMSGKKLKSHIDSLVTGSKATLTVYEHSMFKDRSMAFGPNSREAGPITKLGIGGDIQSLQLSCD
jgi:hypothetical protein